MAYKRLNLKKDDLLDEAVFKHIDDSFELLNNALGNPEAEEYIEIIKSSNLFNKADSPEGKNVGCYQTIMINTAYSSSATYNSGGKDYTNSPPPIHNNGTATLSAASGALTSGLTHYIKVEKGKTYLFKSNNFVTQKNATTGKEYTFGLIKYVRLDNTEGKWIWESKNYNAGGWNSAVDGYGMETGTKTDTWYGTTYAEIVKTELYGSTPASYGYASLLIKFNIDGWVRIVLGHTANSNVYGSVSTIDDIMTEETFRTILDGFQVNETQLINAPFEEWYELEENKVRYNSALNDRDNVLEARIDALQSNFVATPYFSKNMYDNSTFTNNNQYISQPSITNWNNSKYNAEENPLKAGLVTIKYGKNLCSGWVKLTNAGTYTIQQFQQVVDERSNKKFGYIGVVLGMLGNGTLVFQNTGYIGSAITESTYFKEITSAKQNMTKYTFEKLTDDVCYVCWFMSLFENTNVRGYHLPSDTTYPSVTEEEMAIIKGNTMLYEGSNVKVFEAYHDGPLGYNYLVGIDSIDGLREQLDSADSGGAASSLTESITIENSDKIGFFGNSFFSGYCLEGHHPTDHLGSWSDYILYNYSNSGDDILETLEAVEKNVKRYGSPIAPKDFNLTYAVIAQQDNDGALHAMHYESYYENSKKLAKYLAGFGAKCILGTEHDTNPYYYNMMRLAQEEGYMFMDWGTISTFIPLTTFKPFVFNGHPATRGHWLWVHGMKQFFDTLPRPRKSIKLFNARNIDTDNSTLLYNTNIERAKVWRDFNAGCICNKNPQYFDRLCEAEGMKVSTKESEYMKLHAGEMVVAKPKVLAEIITPFTSTHLKELKVTLNTSASKVYIKKNTSLIKPLSAQRYLAFGIGDNSQDVFTAGGTITVSAGVSGNVTGSNIEGSYTIEGVTGNVVVTKTASSGRETSGTDILEATVDGVAISNLMGSYDYPSANYGNRWNQPLCEWKEIQLDDYMSFTIDNVEDAKCYFDFDKISFLLEDTEGQDITITEISATVSGNGEKNRENNYKILKPIKGISKFADTDFANSNKWTTIMGDISYPSKLTYTSTSGSKSTEPFPSGTTSTIQLESNTGIGVKLDNLTRDLYSAPMLQVRVIARRLPPVCFTDEDYETTNVITPDYYPCGTLKVGLTKDLTQLDCDYFAAIEVGLTWNMYIFNIPLQDGADNLRIYSESDWIQIARVEVDQISNYVTFS